MGAPEAPGIRDRVAAVQEVVRGEILEQVADRALNRQREQHRARDVPLGVLRLFAHRRHGFETDQQQNRDARLDEDEAESMRRDDRSGAGVEVERLRVLRVPGLPVTASSGL